MYRTLLQENKMLRIENSKLQSKLNMYYKQFDKPVIIMDKKDIVLTEAIEELKAEDVEEAVMSEIVYETVDEVVEVVEEISMIEVVPEIVVEVVSEIVAEDTIDKHVNKPKYKCLKCGYMRKPNCMACRNNI